MRAMRTLPPWVLAALVCTVAPAAADAQVTKIQLVSTGGTVSVRDDTPLGMPVPGSLLEVECDQPTQVDCSKVSVRGHDGSNEIAPEAPGPAPQLTRSFTLKAEAAGKKIQILYANKKIADASMSADSGEAPGPTACRPPASVGSTYDRATNHAEFWVSHLGNIWAYPSDQVDEDDEVVVNVTAPEALIPMLRVKRASKTRVVGGITIIGEEVFRQALEQPSTKCGVLRVVLKDFAPGAGQVQITLQSGDKELPTGSFEFSVAPLYDGYLSYGAIYTDALPRTYKLAPSAGGTIIVPGEAIGPGDRDIRFAVFYTAFVWGKREVVKGPARWYHRVNPTFGITTSELAEHALYGVSVDIGTFTLGIGVHSGRQTILHPDSGLQAGSVFTGKAEEIPTARDWTHKAYLSVGADLRAVVALFKSALGVGKFGAP